MDAIIAAAAFTEKQLEDLVLCQVIAFFTRPLTPRMPYSVKLDLSQLTDSKCRRMFRFDKHGLNSLVEYLEIPDEIVSPQGVPFTGLQALMITLHRLSYPNRLYDLQRLFGINASVLSAVCNHIVQHICLRCADKLGNLHANHWLSEEKLMQYSEAIHQKGAPLTNCWAFIDSTARRICRPTDDQQLYYSGDKQFHCIKFQLVCTPDGLTINLKGPFEGRRHDAGMLIESGLQEHLLEFMAFPRQQNFIIYGNPAYPNGTHICRPFVTTRIAAAKLQHNKDMSSVRQAVEWGIGKVSTLFAFTDFHKNQKIQLQNVADMYKAATILTNCHTCLYGGQTSTYFGVKPPQLAVYLSNLPVNG